MDNYFEIDLSKPVPEPNWKKHQKFFRFIYIEKYDLKLWVDEEVLKN